MSARRTSAAERWTATDLGLKKQENVKDAFQKFQEQVEATVEANRTRYDEFSEKRAQTGSALIRS